MWHGVSGRGASEVWLPEPLAQRSLQCNSYILNPYECSAELFAGHPVPLELDEKRIGVESAVGYCITWNQEIANRTCRQWSASG